MPVIDTESGMRNTDGPAKRVRSDAGVPLAAGGTITATNVQDAIDQLAAATSGGGGTSITLSGDVTGTGAAAITTTLATVNSNVGTFQGITVNAKGLVTAAVNQTGIIPENSKSANYTTVLGDAGQFIYHPASDANARTFTIDSNANVAYLLGTVISFVNLSANALTIAITTDTMYLAGPGTTGSRTLAQYGCCTALKTDTTAWIVSGTGLT